MIKARIPVIGFIGWSGSGKTTLLVKLLTHFKQQGLNVGMIKHAHHDVEFDKPHKDSYKLRKAGASQMLLATAKRWALMVDLSEQQNEPNLQQMVNQLDQNHLDFILVEGFKHTDYPKIEVYNSTLNKPIIHPDMDDIFAVITDHIQSIQTSLPAFNRDDISQIADFIISHYS